MQNTFFVLLGPKNSSRCELHAHRMFNLPIAALHLFVAAHIYTCRHSNITPPPLSLSIAAIILQGNCRQLITVHKPLLH